VGLFAASRGLAIADIIIKLQQEIAAIAAKNAALAVAFPLAAPVFQAQTPIQIATAKVRAGFGIATIAAQSIGRFQDGGVLEGPRHSAGGVPIRMASGGMVEAEGGEAIINRRSTAQFGTILSAINQAGGGKKFQEGGTLPSVGLQSAETLATGDLNSAINNINMRPVVSVEEIKEVTNRVEVIEQTATL